MSMNYVYWASPTLARNFVGSSFHEYRQLKTKIVPDKFLNDIKFSVVSKI